MGPDDCIVSEMKLEDLVKANNKQFDLKVCFLVEDEYNKKFITKAKQMVGNDNVIIDSHLFFKYDSSPISIYYKLYADNVIGRGRLKVENPKIILENTENTGSVNLSRLEGIASTKDKIYCYESISNTISIIDKKNLTIVNSTITTDEILRKAVYRHFYGASIADSMYSAIIAVKDQNPSDLTIEGIYSNEDTAYCKVNLTAYRLTNLGLRLATIPAICRIDKDKLLFVGVVSAVFTTIGDEKYYAGLPPFAVNKGKVFNAINQPGAVSETSARYVAAELALNEYQRYGILAPVPLHAPKSVVNSNTKYLMSISKFSNNLFGMRFSDTLINVSNNKMLRIHHDANKYSVSKYEAETVTLKPKFNLLSFNDFSDKTLCVFRDNDILKISVYIEDEYDYRYVETIKINEQKDGYFTDGIVTSNNGFYFYNYKH